MGRGAALGFDVGTTSVKAGLVWLDADEPMMAVGFPYPTSRPLPGWAEQDPTAWLTTMARCWEALGRLAGPVEIRCVGICSQVNTHLLVDEGLSPLCPAITWQDTRASREAAELDARAADRREELWGGPFTVDASFSLSRLAWWARREPEVRRRARWLLSPRDFCVAALTGEVVSDAISPIGLVDAGGAYVGDVVALVDGAAGLLPPLAAFDAPAGRVLEGNPVGLPAGVPVSVGTMDAWASVFGSGLVRPGQAMEVAGTSEVLAVLSDRAVPTRGIITFAPVHGRILHAGPTQAGGAALEWASRGLGRPVHEILALAEAGRRHPRPLLFMPHLAGERAPHWNPDARGVFIGIDHSTDLRHLALAVLEGVAFAARQSLGACEAAAGLPADEVRLSGGGARSRLWNEVKSSIHGRTLSLLESLDSGVLGAVLLGIVAAGLEPDLERAAERRVRVASRVDPDPSERGRADELFESYQEAYRALAPLFPRFATAPDRTP